MATRPKGEDTRWMVGLSWYWMRYWSWYWKDRKEVIVIVIRKEVIINRDGGLRRCQESGVDIAGVKLCVGLHHMIEPRSNRHTGFLSCM